MSELELTAANFEKEVLASEKPVLVDLWAPWCGPCRMLAPVIDDIAKDYAGKVTVAKLNTDENVALAQRYQTNAIPTLLFFNGGKVVERLVGIHSKAEIAKLLNALLANGGSASP